MDDNTKSLVDDLNNAYYDKGEMNAQIRALHAVVDDEEISSAEKNYCTSTISTDLIRMIFGWAENPKVKQIRDAKEAEKRNERVDERTEG